MFRSPQDSHDDHLRNLLDQRSSRTDVHGRFSTISEYSDTASVYSRPNFSPKPSDKSDNQTYRGDGYASPIASSLSLSNANHFHDPPTSMLDLDDDPRSSFAASESYDDDHTPYEDEGDVEPVARMSYLGPKMRFHSRAPWEMEDDALDEDEIDDSPRHFPSGFPFSRAPGLKPATSGSSSPQPSYSSRPSEESARSQVPPRRSFETINSQISYPRGALYTLAQETLSTNSLARGAGPPAPPKETLRGKFSLGRLRPEAPTVSLPSSPIRGRFPPSIRGHEQPKPSFDTTAHSNTHTPYTNKSHTSSVKEPIHPYANPDLVASYAEDQPPHTTSYPTPTYVPPPRNDSNVTITESFSAHSMMKSSVRLTHSPEASPNPFASKSHASSIQSKTISSPVPAAVVGPVQRMDAPVSDNRQDYAMNTLPPGVSNLSGWTEHNATPTFTLISLEEARAQRTRSSTANPPSRLSTSSGTSNSSTPFPAGETESTTFMQASESSVFGNLASRARGRSISAGAKAKNTIQTIVGQPKSERRDSEPAVMAQQSGGGAPGGKSLKHKKSGFMRLFNGGKALEKDERNSPPPVPSLPDTISNSQPLPRIPKSSVHRIPVPSLSPSLFEADSAQSSDSLLIESNSKTNVASPRRTPPTLSINTVQQGLSSRASTSAVAERPMHTRLNVLERPWQNDQPQSAPPVVSEFPALKLRPVSTLFSAHFTDHLVTADSRTSAETAETTDLDTPRSPSPNGLISPITPGSYSRTSNDQLPILSVLADDQSVVKALQEQLISAKTAWQGRIWELEGQVRDLKVELEETKGTKGKHSDDYCETCGRGKRKKTLTSVSAGGGVVNRPRARTATSSRFGHPLP